jgi:hypothetical protein
MVFSENIFFTWFIIVQETVKLDDQLGMRDAVHCVKLVQKFRRHYGKYRQKNKNTDMKVSVSMKVSIKLKQV